MSLNPNDKYKPQKVSRGPITGPPAWYGETIKKSSEWLVKLSDDDILEIENAVQISNDLEIKDISQTNFPLPSLGPKLKEQLDHLLNGRGFVLIRGLPVEQYTIEFTARAYWGIGSYLGSPRSQNANGDLLGHVIDLSRSADDPNARIYQTSARQNYHCDSTDIVGLLCLEKAMSGGVSTIVSSVTLYNEILERKPDLLEELGFPFYIDRRGEVPAEKEPWYRMPVFVWHKEFLTTHFTRPYMNSARRFSNVPPLTERQIEALDYFQELCEDKKIYLDMDFEPGDMQFLHNYQILHDRTAFRDWPDGTRKRHLLRLWLCTPKGRELPPIYLERQESIKIGDRGGIIVPGTHMNVTLDIR